MHLEVLIMCKKVLQSLWQILLEDVVEFHWYWKFVEVLNKQERFKDLGRCDGKDELGCHNGW